MDSSFVSNPKQAWGSIQSLLDTAEMDILPNVTVPVYLYVTGGVRKLPEREQKAILEEIEQGASNSHNHLTLVQNQSFILTGMPIKVLHLTSR